MSMTPAPRTTPTTRFLAYATLLTALVATLAGVAVSLTEAFVPLSPLPEAGPSGVGAVATSRALPVLFLAVLALYVLVPVAVAAYGVVYGERHWLAPVTWGAVALLALPWSGYVLTNLLPPWYPPDVARGVVALVAGPALVVLASRVAADRGPDGIAPTPSAAAFLNVVLLVVFVAGMAVGGGVLVQPLSGAVEDVPVLAPTAAWDFEYERVGDGSGLLTVTHDGGDLVDADHLYVRGSGFADVTGADRTEPGPWTGETTDGALRVGDSTTVGVTGDCEIQLVYENGAAVQTLGVHECRDRRDGARVGRSRHGGGR